jgi:ferritin
MPCRDYRDNDPNWEENQNTREQNRNLEKRCDKLTALLCEACDKLAIGDDLTYDLLYWYNEHRGVDLENLQNMLDRLDITKLDKDSFDALDDFLSDLEN